MNTAISETVLVVDDIPSLRAIYQSVLADAGYRPLAAKTAAEGLDLFRRSGVQIVVLDMFLPDRDGLDLMREMLSIRPSTAIIVVTADLSIDRAVAAMRLGAQDFLLKPVADMRLLGAISQARDMVLRSEAAAPVSPAPAVAGFVGTSAAISKLNDALREASLGSGPVYLWGEEGTGKGLAARSIHMLTDTTPRPFIIADFTGISPETFGHKMFGGPDGPGFMRRATGGMLVLCRIAELDLPLQRELFSALSAAGAPRVVASTTPSLDDAQTAGRLDPDFARWLGQTTIRVPSLRERREDILPLARAFLQRSAAQNRRALRRFQPTTEAILLQNDWPGNVRQLIDTISAITVLHDGETVTPCMLPTEIRPSPPLDTFALDALANMTLAEIERHVIEAALMRHDGVVPRAAEQLGVAASTIYRKMGVWRES